MGRRPTTSGIRHFHQLIFLVFYLKINKPKFYLLKLEEYLKYSSCEARSCSPVQPQTTKSQPKGGKEGTHASSETVSLQYLLWADERQDNEVNRPGGNMSYVMAAASSSMWSLPSLLPWMHPTGSTQGFFWASGMSLVPLFTEENLCQYLYKSHFLSAPLPLSNLHFPLLPSCKLGISYSLRTKIHPVSTLTPSPLWINQTFDPVSPGC